MIYDYLTEGKIPEDLKGNKNKNKLKSWKKRAKKIELRKKDDKKELTFLNSTFVLIRRGKIKIIVRKNELQAIWKKFHAERGHIGMCCCVAGRN